MKKKKKQTEIRNIAGTMLVLTTALGRGDVISPGQDIFNYFPCIIMQIYLYDLTVNATGARCYLSGNQGKWKP